MRMDQMGPIMERLHRCSFLAQRLMVMDLLGASEFIRFKQREILNIPKILSMYMARLCKNGCVLMNVYQSIHTKALYALDLGFDCKSSVRNHDYIVRENFEHIPIYDQERSPLEL